MSASLNWIAWCSAIALAEGAALLARSRGATSNAACAIPSACAAIPIRPPSSVAIATVKPLPSSCEQPVPPDLGALDHDVVRHGGIEAELLLLSRDSHMVGVEDEGRDALGPRRVGVGAGEEQERRGVLAVRDPLLGAGDRPAVAVLLGLRAKRAGIGAGFGLGQREGADALATRERRDEARPLLVGAESEDRERASARVHRDRDANAGVGTRELLEHENVGQEVGARAAVLLRDTDAHEPELGELRIEVARESVLAVPVRGVRRDLGVRELTRERLDLPLVVGELEVHYE